MKRPSLRGRMRFALPALVVLIAHSADAAGKIVFTSWRTGTQELWLMDDDGNNQQRLTFFGVETAMPAWSPDASKIAFASNKDTGSDALELFVMNADGSGLTKIVETSQVGGLRIHNPSWHPDGTKIVFSAVTGCCTGGVWTVELDDLSLEPLLTGYVSDTDYSPTGEQIAFNLKANSLSFSPRLWVMNGDGTGQQLLTPECCSQETAVVRLDWAPHPDRIVFDHGLDIFTADGDGQNREELTTGGTWPPNPYLYTDSSWSPDGTQIVFVRGGPGSDIWVMNADGSDRVQLTFTGNNGSPSWADVGGCPDPATIDYQGYTAADCAVPQNTVVVFDQAELDAYMTDFGWDGTHVRNLNVKFNPTGDVVIVSPCEVNLAGEGGFLDIVAESVCVYGRKGVTVAQDASNPDQGIAAETILLVSEEGSAGFSQGLTVTAGEMTVQALKEAKVGLSSLVTVDGPLTLRSTGDLASSHAIIRQGSNVVAEEIVLSASRGATVGKLVSVATVGELCLESTGSAVKSVAAIRQGAVVEAGALKQTSGNKATVGKNATIEVAGAYEMDAAGSCSVAASASITAGSTSGSCFE